MMEHFKFNMVSFICIRYCTVGNKAFRVGKRNINYENLSKKVV